MIWHNTKKEILTKILDFRFIISNVIALLLIILSTVILSEQYLKQVEEFNEFVRSDEEALNDVKVFSQLRLNVHRPPNPLSIFNKGVSKQVDTSMRIRHTWVPRQEAETRTENPFMNIFQHFDLTTIFQIVLSLLAILLVYDSISGEREEGTLKAMLSYSVARYEILTSKLVASLMGLAIPIFMSFLVSYLIMLTVYGITFDGEQWIRIGLIILSTFIFLGFFVTAGLLVSSLVRSASISLIWLTFIWVVTIVIQPNLGSYLASTVVSIPPREKIDSAEDQVWTEMDKKIEQLENEIREEVPGGAWHSNHSDGDAYYHCFDGNRVALLRYVLRTQRMQPLITEYAEREWQVYQAEYNEYLNRQLFYQNLFDKMSPAALFARMTASLSQTDISHYETFLDQARTHRQSYLSYLLNDRKVFSENANLYFCRQTMDQIENSDYDERLEKAGGPGKKMESFGPEDYPALDLTDLPEFNLKYPSVIQSIRFILLDLGILICISLILFYLCAISFNRYDVRAN